MEFRFPELEYLVPRNLQADIYRPGADDAQPSLSGQQPGAY
jgi:hypothetical protein